MAVGEGREKWHERYVADSGRIRAPSAWIVEQASRIPPGSLVVDIAGGDGRHAIPLVVEGRRVVLVDFVEHAVRSARRREPRLDGVVADVWALPFRPGSLDAIVVVNFLERELFPVFTSLLRPGGLLIYETYTRGNVALVDAGLVRAPRSPHYTLESGELPRLVAPLVIRAQREGRVDDAAGLRIVASVVAEKT
jgi:SAM-dependent methyltransferase